MAIVDLTNVDPYAAEVESQRRGYEARNQAFANIADGFSKSIERNQVRRQNLEVKNEAFRNREYELVNNKTSQLVQPNSNSQITDIHLQQTGMNFKSEMYDAIQAYEESDKGSDARKIFEETKAKVGASAKTISGALGALGTQMETWRQDIKDGGISNAVDPKLRMFMADMIDPDTDSSKYQIVSDEKTGQLKYIDTETGGEEVNFFLDDIANGENQFTSIPEPNMPKLIGSLMKDVKQLKKQEKLDNGSVVEITDWNEMRNALNGRMDSLLEDESNFKAIAAKEGFGYEAFQTDFAGGEIFTDDEGKEYASIDDIKDEVKSDLFNKMESITPHEEKVLFNPNQEKTLQEKAIVQQQKDKIAVEAQSLTSEAIASTDWSKYINRQATINGLDKSFITKVVPGKDGLITIEGRKGKQGTSQEFNTKKIEGRAQLQAALTGQDYNLIKSSIEEDMFNRLKK